MASTDLKEYVVSKKACKSAPLKYFKIEWSGEREICQETSLSSIFRPKVPGDYVDIHVLHMWDTLRLGLCLVSLMLALFQRWIGSTLDLPAVCIVTDIPCLAAGNHDESLPSWWRALTGLSLFAQSFQWFEILNFFILFRAYKIKNSEGVTMRACSWAYTKIYGTKYEFVPFDSRAFLWQQVWLCGIGLANTLAVNLVPLAMTVSPLDVTVAAFGWPIAQAIYLSHHARNCVCVTRSLGSVAAANCWVKPPPRRWNGLTIHNMVHSVSGPEFAFDEDGVYKMKYPYNPKIYLKVTDANMSGFSSFMEKSLVMTRWISPVLFWNHTASCWGLVGICTLISSLVAYSSCIIAFTPTYGTPNLGEKSLVADRETPDGSTKPPDSTESIKETMADEAAAAQEASHLPEAEWTAQAPSSAAAKEGANRLLETEPTVSATAVAPAHPFEVLHPAAPKEEATPVLEVQGAVSALLQAGAEEEAVLVPCLAKADDAARPFEGQPAAAAEEE